MERELELRWVLLLRLDRRLINSSVHGFELEPGQRNVHFFFYIYIYISRHYMLLQADACLGQMAFG